MIARLFLNLTEYPAFKRIIWKPIYEIVAKKFKAPDWQFMNYGYVPDKIEQALELSPNDEVNRYSIQLYHYLAITAEVEGKEILEVGSGRGGGANYIFNYLRPAKFTGLDIASNAVKLANEKHAAEGLSFVQGNAEKLPFADDSFDIVLNVESCHAYGSVPAFLKEVKRVLRPGGHFLCTDMRSPSGMKDLINNIRETGLRIAIQEEITRKVVQAIEDEEPLKQQRIAQNIPRWCSKIFREFAGVVGSKIHKDLKTGSLVYYRFVLQKQSFKNKNYNHEKNFDTADVNDSLNVTEII